MITVIFYNVNEKASQLLVFTFIIDNDIFSVKLLSKLVH